MKLSGIISSITPVIVQNALRKFLKKGDSPIVFFINSGGGDFYATLKIFFLLRLCSAPIVTVADRNVSSGGFILSQAGVVRFGITGTRFLFHNAVWRPKETEFQVADLSYKLTYLQRVDAQQVLIFCERGRPISTIQQLFYDEAELSMKRAMEFHLIDGILQRRSYTKMAKRACGRMQDIDLSASRFPQ